MSLQIKQYNHGSNNLNYAHQCGLPPGVLLVGIFINKFIFSRINLPLILDSIRKKSNPNILDFTLYIYCARLIQRLKIYTKNKLIGDFVILLLRGQYIHLYTYTCVYVENRVVTIKYCILLNIFIFSQINLPMILVSVQNKSNLNILGFNLEIY